MQFSHISAAVLAFASSVAAQTAGFDVFSTPVQDEVVPGGKTYTVSWTPSEQTGTVSLVLLQGATNTSLQLGDFIARNVSSKSGSYQWSVPSAPRFKVYGIKLQLDSDPDTFQYSFAFSISASESTTSSVSASSTVTMRISQVGTPTSAPATINLNTTVPTATSSATISANITSTTISQSVRTSVSVVPASSSRVVTAPSATPTINAAAGLVAGSGAGMLAFAMALFL